MIDKTYEQWRETVNALFTACVEADSIPSESILAWFRQAVEDDRAYHANLPQPVLPTPSFRIERTDGNTPVRRFT